MTLNPGVCRLRDFNGGDYIQARLTKPKCAPDMGSGALELGDAEYVLRTRRFRTGAMRIAQLRDGRGGGGTYLPLRAIQDLRIVRPLAFGAACKGKPFVSVTLHRAVRTDLGVVRSDLGVARTDLGVIRTDLGVVRTELGVARTDLGAVRTELGWSGLT